MAIPLAIAAGVSTVGGLIASLFGNGARNRINEQTMRQMQTLYDRALGGDGDAMQSLMNHIQRIQEQRWEGQTEAGDLGYSAPGAGEYWSSQTYTPEEQRRLRDSQGLEGLLPTEEELSAMGYSQEEIGAILGDPYGALNYFGEQAGGAQTDLGFTEDRLFDTLSEQGRNIRGDTAAAGRRGYSALERGNSELDSVGGNPNLRQREGYQSEINSIADDGSLGLDPNFSAGYEFGDKDLGDLEYLANRSTSASYDKLLENVRRRMASSGANNPLAMAGLADEYQSEAAADAGDTAVGARLSGRREQLDRMKDKEGMRLDAADNQARLRIGTRTQGESQRLSSEQYIAQLQKAIAEGKIDRELGLNAMLAELNMTGERYLGSSQLDTIRQAGNARQALQSDIRNTGSRLRQQGEESASRRAGEVAAQRANTARYIPQQRFQNGLTLSNTRTGREAGIANQRLGFEQERRGYHTGQIGLNQSGMNSGAAAAGGFWNSRQTAGQNAANGYGNAGANVNSQPNALERGISTGVNLFGAISPYTEGSDSSSRPSRRTPNYHP